MREERGEEAGLGTDCIKTMTQTWHLWREEGEDAELAEESSDRSADLTVSAKPTWNCRANIALRRSPRLGRNGQAHVPHHALSLNGAAWGKTCFRLKVDKVPESANSRRLPAKGTPCN